MLPNLETAHYISAMQYLLDLNNPRTPIGQDFQNAIQESAEKKAALEKYMDYVILFITRQEEREQKEFEYKQKIAKETEEKYLAYLDSLPPDTKLETAGNKTVEELKQELQKLDQDYSKLTQEQNDLYQSWEADRKESAMNSLKAFKEKLEAAGLVLTTPDGKPIDLNEAKLAQLAEAYAHIPKRIFEINPALNDLINQQTTAEGKLQIIETILHKANLNGGVEAAKHTGGDEKAPLLEGKVVMDQLKKIDNLHSQTVNLDNGAFYDTLSSNLMNDHHVTNDVAQKLSSEIQKEAHLQWIRAPKILAGGDASHQTKREKTAEDLAVNMMKNHQDVFKGSEQEKQALKQLFLSAFEKERPAPALGEGKAQQELLKVISDHEISLKKVETNEKKSTTLEQIANKMHGHQQKARPNPGLT